MVSFSLLPYSRSYSELIDPTFAQRFGDGSNSNVSDRLKTLRQRGTVDAYVREFEALVAQIPNLFEVQLLGCFLGASNAQSFIVYAHVFVIYLTLCLNE